MCWGLKKVPGTKKRPQREAFFRINDRLVTSLRTSPADASDKNGACRLVVNVAHCISGLAEDHGLNAECIDNSDTGADLLIDQHLRQRKLSGTGRFDGAPVATAAGAAVVAVLRTPSPICCCIICICCTYICFLYEKN